MDKHDELTNRDRAFEVELAQAMSRVPAPGSLEVALMNLAEAEQAQKARQAQKPNRILAFPRMQLWFGGAVAAVLAIGVFSLEGVHVHHEHERTVATQQFEEAQQITDRTLERTREHLAQKGIYLAQQ